MNRLRKPLALFIDLDDTLITYSAVVPRAWATVIREHHAKAGFDDPESLYKIIHENSSRYWSDAARHREGRLSLRETRRIIVAMALEEAGRPNRVLAKEIADAFSDIREELIIPFPGAVETLAALRERGFPLVMITNGQSSLQRAKIDRYDLAKHFDHILVEEEFGAGKPDPAIYREALSLSGMEAADAWMIGDNLDWDIRGAQALGIAGIWNDFAGTGLKAKLDLDPGGPGLGEISPDAVIHSFAEIPALIDGAF